MDYFDFPPELPEESLPIPPRGGKRAKMEQLREAVEKGDPKAISELSIIREKQKQANLKYKLANPGWNKKYDKNPLTKEKKNAARREQRASKKKAKSNPS